MAHTPGPWEVGRGAGWIVTRPHAVGRREAALAIGMTPAYSLISAPTCKWFKDGEAEANARLIAAAPDLLAALEALADVPDVQGWPETDQARAAIAKAKGE